MPIEIEKSPVDSEALRKEWQEKHDPNLEDLQGMRKFIEERMGVPPVAAPDEVSAGKFNNFQ